MNEILNNLDRVIRYYDISFFKNTLIFTEFDIKGHTYISIVHTKGEKSFILISNTTMIMVILESFQNDNEI